MLRIATIYIFSCFSELRLAFEVWGIFTRCRITEILPYLVRKKPSFFANCESGIRQTFLILVNFLAFTSENKRFDCPETEKIFVIALFITEID